VWLYQTSLQLFVYQCYCILLHLQPCLRLVTKQRHVLAGTTLLRAHGLSCSRG
jgi:hypothetical protein